MKDIYFKVEYGIFDLVSCVFVIWILNPMSHEYYNPICICLISLVWMLFAYMSNKKCFTKALCSRIFFCSLIYPIVMNIYALLGHSRFEKSSLGIPILVLFYMYFYYRKDVRKNRLIYYVGIFYILSISIYTLIQLYGNHDISRLLANGDRQDKAQLVSPFTAGYYEIYSYVFLTIVIFKEFITTKSKLNSVKFLLILMLLSVLFIKAQYTIAVLLFVFGIALLQFERRNIWMILMLSVIALLGIISLLETDGVSHLIYSISNVIPEGILKNRIIQIGDLLTKETPKLRTNGAVTRFTLYNISWNTFISHPIFGVADREILSNRDLIGGHSTFFDRLAQYWIFGGGIYISSKIYILVKICKTLPQKWRYVYSINILLYILLTVLNTSHRNNLFLMLAVFIPIFVIYMDDNNNKERRNNGKKNFSNICSQ